MRKLCRSRLALLLGLSTCTVGPDFRPPGAPNIAHWKDSRPGDATVHEAVDPDPAWWNRFRDPKLTRLIKTAISGNLDLQQAVLRVVEARQSVLTARAAGLPMLNGTGSYNREQEGLKGILQSEGVYSSLGQQSLSQRSEAGLNDVLSKAVQPFDLFQYGLDASWELDLFGQVRRSVEQAKANLQGQQEATRESLIMLESQVAKAYVQLRGAQALTASQQQNIRTARNSLGLTQKLQRQGLGTALDTDQAQTQLLSYQQQLPDYEKQAQQAVNQLDVLVGQPPGTLDAELSPSAPLPGLPAVVDLGIPSGLARRRPDIRQAEAQLHAATANIGIAVASFYPDISLTGNLGIRALDASYLTRWASHFYAAGPSISLPIFQGGKLTANLRLARAEAGASVLNYRGTVLNALSEVENDLVAYRTDRAEREKLAATVRSSQDTLHLATDQYSNGLATFIQVLDDERTLVSAQQQLVQTDMTLVNDVVSLYVALGGGWEQVPVAVPELPPGLPPVPAALDSVAADTTP